MTKKILITYAFDESWGREALDKLEKIGDIKVNPHKRRPYTEVELAKEVVDFDAVIKNSDPFTAKIIEAADKLKIIANFGVGSDTVDVETATKKGIYVTITPALSETVAEFAIGLIFAVTKRITQLERSVQAGCWDSESLLGQELSGKTLGIIGLGRIGSEVARKVPGFNMRVLYYDLYRRSKEEEDNLRIEYSPLESLLKESDIVTIHVPLTRETEKLIGEEQISLMKNGAYLINTARGRVVNEGALYKALKEGKLSGAGLDVLAIEPPPQGNPLLKLENVVITPHAASATFEARRRMAIMAAEDVVAALSGKVPGHLVNPKVLEKPKT